MVAVSVVDCFEFSSIYFASVLDQRHIIPTEKKLFHGIFSRWFSFLRALIPELSSGISPFDFWPGTMKSRVTRYSRHCFFNFFKLLF